MKKRIALVLALILAFTLTGCKSSDYKSALEAMNNGNYETAAQQLEALGDYKESQQMLRQCRYALAVEDFNNENFEKAVEEFRNLGDYLDAASYVTRAEDGLLQQKIVGSWHSEMLDFTDVYLSEIESEIEGLADTLREQNISLEMTVDITFREDGTCSVVGSYGDVDAFMEKLSTSFTTAIEKELEQEFAAQNITLEKVYEAMGVSSVDEIFQAISGLTVQEFMDTSGVRELLETSEEAMAYNGKFTVTNGVIQCAGNEISYNAQDDTLNIQMNSKVQDLLGVDGLPMSRTK